MARDSKGRWLPGECPNPKGGRPPIGARFQLRELAPAAMQVLRDKLADGDIQAATWVLNRLIPPLRAVSPPVAVTLPDGAPLSEQGRTVLLELAKGNLSADECSALLGALQNQSRLIELTEVLPLLAELERMVKGNQ